MRKISFLLFTAFMICLISCEKNSDENIALKLKKFYSYYMIEMDKNPKEFSLDTLKKYCTNSFITKRENEKEIDLMMLTQDYDPEWLKTLTIIPLNDERNNKYNICFQAEEKHCFIVTLMKENGDWKIDGVQDNN